MSQEYCILNLLNIEDKNIKLTENFYKIEDFDGIKYKVIEGILSYEPPFCPRCGCIFNKEQTYEKNGFKTSDILMLDVCNHGCILRLHKQRYLCKHCNKAYTVNPKEKKYSEDKTKKAIKLYMEGNSGRVVRRILGISKNTCLYWIKKYAKKIEEKTYSNERVKVIEMDELYSFIERKKQNLCDNDCEQG